jgi:hypothetical protein
MEVDLHPSAATGEDRRFVGACLDAEVGATASREGCCEDEVVMLHAEMEGQFGLRRAEICN